MHRSLVFTRSLRPRFRASTCQYQSFFWLSELSCETGSPSRQLRSKEKPGDFSGLAAVNLPVEVCKPLLLATMRGCYINLQNQRVARLRIDDCWCCAAPALTVYNML